MYKVGDKVETPYGVGIVMKSNSGVKVKFNSRQELILQEYQVKPYTSAHDKLIAMGYGHSQLSEDLTDDYYSKGDNNFIWFSRENKSYNVGSFVEVDLELSRILTQLLEEMK